MGYVIGCDIGSQSAKAVLLSPDGAVLGTASSPYAMNHPHSGWAGQDPEDYMRGMGEAVRQVLRQADVPGRAVTHVALSSQVDGVVPVDESLRPLRDAIIWLDRRATAEVAQLAGRVGADEVFAVTGLNLDATHTAAKIMWLKEHEPDVYLAARSMPSVGGFMVGWLAGAVVQDHANSSSSLLYDVTARDWSDRMLDVTGVEKSLLPGLAAAHDQVGPLTAEAAETLGLTESCAVVVGTGDDHAACLGAGGIDPNVVIDIVGTAEPIGVASNTPVFDETRLVETHAHAVEGMYLIENPGFVSGGNTLWLGSEVLRVSQQEFFDLAATAPPGANGVRFLPALTGPMAPRWNDLMRGAFNGLSMNHTAADLARAVLEANSFAFRDVFDRLQAMHLGQSVRIVGGGARSDLWLQLKATVTGTSINRVLTEETAATGAAILALLAADAFPDAAAAVEAVVEVDKTAVDPDPALADIYEDAYQEYRRLYDVLEGSFAAPPQGATDAPTSTKQDTA